MCVLVDPNLGFRKALRVAIADAACGCASDEVRDGKDVVPVFPTLSNRVVSRRT